MKICSRQQHNWDTKYNDNSFAILPRGIYNLEKLQIVHKKSYKLSIKKIISIFKIIQKKLRKICIRTKAVYNKN